jgi:transposase
LKHGGIEMAEPSTDSGSWNLPDSLWDRMEKLLPKYKANPKGGRPRSVLRTGCQWNAVPREFGTGSTLHRYFQQWTEAGVFRRLWKASLLEYDKLKSIQWNWQSVDGAMTKSPLGGEKYRQKSD